MEIVKTLLYAIGGFAAVMLLLAYIPSLLGLVIDPLNKRRIMAECQKAGREVTEIKPWPNHYGIKVKKHGDENYLKCRGAFGKLTWKGKHPAQL